MVLAISWCKIRFLHPRISRKEYVYKSAFQHLSREPEPHRKVIEKVFDSLRSSQPTRVVLLIPIFEGKQGHLYETQAKKSRFLEIATFPKGSFSFVAPEHYHISNNFRPGFFSEKIGLYLCANKASLQVDPIDW